jgi:hypothetical protein
MNADDLRSFARRDWAAIGRSRLDYWAKRYADEGDGPARRAATLLHEHALSIGAPMADEHHRAGDLAAHLRVRELLDRAGRAITGR